MVELKDDSEVRGFIETATPNMDVCLINATHTSSAGQIIVQGSVDVKGGMVRYVHLPPKVRVHSAVAQHMGKLDFINSRGRNRIVDSKKKSNDYKEDRTIEMASIDGSAY